MRIGLLITARLKSSRLPLKLLKDLNGFTIIEHVINRCKRIAGVDEIVLCTSTNPQDRPLVDVAMQNGIPFFLGSEVDVLQRLSDASYFYGFDYILNITGENPLLSIDYANQIVDRIRTKREDFVYADGLPIGCAVYGLNVSALKTVCSFKEEIDTEIWGPLINRPEIFSIGKIPIEEFFHRPNLRLTNDYPEDFQLMSLIFEHYPHRSIPSLRSVLTFLDANPKLLDVNSQRTQLALDETILVKINEFFDRNLESILQLKNKIYNDLRQN